MMRQWLAAGAFHPDLAVSSGIATLSVGEGGHYSHVSKPDPADPDHHFVPLNMIYDLNKSNGAFRVGPDGTFTGI